MVTGVLSRGESYQGESDHSSPPTAEVKKDYDFTSIPQYALMTCTGPILYHFLPHHLPLVILFDVHNIDTEHEHKKSVCLKVIYKSFYPADTGILLRPALIRMTSVGQIETLFCVNATASPTTAENLCTSSEACQCTCLSSNLKLN